MMDDPNVFVTMASRLRVVERIISDWRDHSQPDFMKLRQEIAFRMSLAPFSPGWDEARCHWVDISKFGEAIFQEMMGEPDEHPPLMFVCYPVEGRILYRKVFRAIIMDGAYAAVRVALAEGKTREIDFYQQPGMSNLDSLIRSCGRDRCGGIDSGEGS